MEMMIWISATLGLFLFYKFVEKRHKIVLLKFCGGISILGLAAFGVVIAKNQIKNSPLFYGESDRAFNDAYFGMARTGVERSLKLELMWEKARPTESDLVLCDGDLDFLGDDYFEKNNSKYYKDGVSLLGSWATLAFSFDQDRLFCVGANFRPQNLKDLRELIEKGRAQLSASMTFLGEEKYKNGVNGSLFKYESEKQMAHISAVFSPDDKGTFHFGITKTYKPIFEIYQKRSLSFDKKGF